MHRIAEVFRISVPLFRVCPRPASLNTSKYLSRAESCKCSILGALDWLRTVAGDLPDANSGTRHVEALTAKVAGPTAANTVEKNLSISFNFAIKW